MSGSGTQVVMNDSRSQRQPQQRMHQSRTQSIDSANGVASTGSVTTAEVAYSTNSNTNTPSSNNNISSNNPSGCTSDRPGTCGSELCLREHLRLTEELNRTLTAYAELEARSHFAQTLWELSAAREAQHSLMLVAENDRLRGQVNHWRAVAEDTTGQLEAANAQLRNCRDDLHETQQSLQASIASAAAAITAERKEAEEAIAVLKAGHAAELSQVRLQLEQALDDNIRSREVLQKTLESSQKSAEAQRAQLESDAAVAEQRAAGALQAKYEIEVALAEMAAQRSSEREGFERELLILQSANRRCVEEKTKQASELRLLRESYSSVEVHLHEVEAELEQVSGQLRGALDKVMQSAKLEDELEITRTRVAVAEKELGEQREHYEEKIRLQLEAFAKLQRERDADVLRLERDIQRLRRRCESGKIKLAAVLKGMAGADRQPCQTHIQATIGSDGRSENGCGVVEEPLRCDAVALLKQSTAVACMLSSTIRRGITQP
uniref:WGS project CAEQ00000000 data, annotated contig 2263 n=1 Tax=Trypanosoma congolense (strain IL3000) TaxID=1068625 RepID=F9WCT4_TRYCI|nr:unnamed protein product [Trypanosoma congolense IL3000]